MYIIAVIGLSFFQLCLAQTPIPLEAFFLLLVFYFRNFAPFVLAVDVIDFLIHLSQVFFDVFDF